MKIPAFPKIFTVGQGPVHDIFDGEVEITEKIDGSQIAFGKIDGELQIRSKGTIIYECDESHMFWPAWKYLKSLDLKMFFENWVYYGEYLRKPKHNTLIYTRVPLNHIILFGLYSVIGDSFLNWDTMSVLPRSLGLEYVPILYRGKIENIEQIYKLLDTESFLGGQKIEGIVIKNYNKKAMVGMKYIPLMSAKYVSEAFKEKHNKNWKAENTVKGKWELYKEQYRTPARWEKAVQYFRDKNELEVSPRDIGKIIKRVKQDIIEEYKEEIKNYLWTQFGPELMRRAIAGLPEWYKEKLLQSSLDLPSARLAL